MGTGVGDGRRGWGLSGTHRKHILFNWKISIVYNARVGYKIGKRTIILTVVTNAATFRDSFGCPILIVGH